MLHVNGILNISQLRNILFCILMRVDLMVLQVDIILRKITCFQEAWYAKEAYFTISQDHIYTISQWSKCQRAVGLNIFYEWISKAYRKNISPLPFPWLCVMFIINCVFAIFFSNYHFKLHVSKNPFLTAMNALVSILKT